MLQGTLPVPLPVLHVPASKDQSSSTLTKYWSHIQLHILLTLEIFHTYTWQLLFLYSNSRRLYSLLLLHPPPTVPQRPEGALHPKHLLSPWLQCLHLLDQTLLPLCISTSFGTCTYERHERRPLCPPLPPPWDKQATVPEAEGRPSFPREAKSHSSSISQRWTSSKQILWTMHQFGPSISSNGEMNIKM